MNSLVIHTPPPGRTMSELRFAEVLDALHRGKFDVVIPTTTGLVSTGASYHFDDHQCVVVAAGEKLFDFLTDVCGIRYDLNVATGSVESLQKEVKRFEEATAQQSKDIDAQREENDALASELAAAKEANEGLQRELAVTQFALNNTHDCADQMRRQLDASQRAIDGLKQRLDAFDVAATRLRREVLEERTMRREEAASAAIEIEAMEADTASNARTYLETILKLREELSNSKAARDLLDAEINGLRAKHEHGRAPVEIKIEVSSDGSVKFNTGSTPVVITGDVKINGAIAT